MLLNLRDEELQARWPNRIPANAIQSDDAQIGVGVVIEDGAEIRADRVVIGDFAYIGPRVRAIVPELSIGDYTRINADSFLGGTKPMHIGRKCYFGKGVQLDSRGGLTIGEHVGVGSLSQIWTHIRHGDTVQGCRWDREYELVIEDDVWLVARVTVGGAEHIGKRVMVFNESNVTRNLMQDRSYAGNPAQDVTDRLGPQFEPLRSDQKLERLKKDIAKFEAEEPVRHGVLKACLDASEFDDTHACFEVTGRTYTKRFWHAEVMFMKWTLAYFAPAESAL